MTRISTHAPFHSSNVLIGVIFAMSLEFRSVDYYKMALRHDTTRLCTMHVSMSWASFLAWIATIRAYSELWTVYANKSAPESRCNKCWINVMAQIEILVIPVKMKTYYCIPSYFAPLRLLIRNDSDTERRECFYSRLSQLRLSFGCSASWF